MEEKGDDREHLLQKQSSDVVPNYEINKNSNHYTLNVNSNTNQKKTENEGKSLNEHQPEFHLAQRNCYENKICKFTICCFYNNYDLTLEEFNAYNMILKEYGKVYDENNEYHENLLKQVYSKLLKYKSSFKLVTNKIENSQNYIDDIWKTIGFQVNFL